MASKNELNQSSGNANAPKELRELAGLELKERQLLEDSMDVERDYRKLMREIRLKELEIPWDRRSARRNSEFGVSETVCNANAAMPFRQL